MRYHFVEKEEYMLMVALLCCSKPEPPQCDDEEDYACFRGAFRTLLGAPVEDMELCTPDLPDVPANSLIL